MAGYKVNDVFVSPELGSTHIMGGIEAQMETFFNERIFSDFAKDVIYKETEEQFSLRLDDSTPVGMWRGEFWGKWIISACRVAKYKKDDDLKEFIRKGALNVIATADPDGYIGTYKDKTYFFPLPLEKGIEATGHDTDWNWNIWCRKYTLWGLIEAYTLTGDRKILDGTVRFADQLIDMLDSMNVKLSQTGTFSGMPSGSIIKPMLQLYLITDDKKYLDFCVDAAEDWDRNDGKMPNLIANARSGKPVHLWYPYYKYPYKYQWAKAYEMMSCLDGLIELYRVTGTAKYFNAAETIYRQLRENEYNALYGVGFNDIFLHASDLINSITEPCDVIHWMRLSYELFKLTGEASYMDNFEKAFLNPFLASSFSDGKWGARGARCVGRHLVAHGQSYMKNSHCCVNNMPRGYMNACEAFVMKRDDGIYVNMFTPYECSIAGSEIKISGSYLEDGKVKISVNTNEKAKLYIRIPEWSRETVINNNKLHAPGSYHAIALEDGISEIDISFDMNARLSEFSGRMLPLEDDDPRIVRFITGNDIPREFALKERRCRVLYGPLILAKSLKNGNTKEDMFKSPAADASSHVTIKSVTPKNTRDSYEVVITSSAGTQKISMCDYATGSNEESSGEQGLFNIYI